MPITLEYQINQDVVTGYITYLNAKAPQPIRVLGKIKDNHAYLKEYESDGNITGFIYAQVRHNQLAQINWNNGDKYDDFLGNGINLPLRPRQVIPLAMDKNRIGNYRYHFSSTHGNHSAYVPAGEMTVRYLHQQYLIEGSTVSSNGGLADIDPTPLHQSKQFFDITDEKNPSARCRYHLRFFEDFLVIDDANHNCIDKNFFSINATLENIYIKTQD